MFTRVILIWATILQKQGGKKSVLLTQLNQDPQKCWYLSSLLKDLVKNKVCNIKTCNNCLPSHREMWSVAKKNCKCAAFRHFPLGNGCLYLFADLSHCSQV